MSQAKSAERVGRDIRRKTRRRLSAEEKIRIVLEGLRGSGRPLSTDNDRLRPGLDDQILDRRSAYVLCFPYLHAYKAEKSEVSCPFQTPPIRTFVSPEWLINHVFTDLGSTVEPGSETGGK